MTLRSAPSVGRLSRRTWLRSPRPTRAAYLDLVKVGASLAYAEYRTHAMLTDETVSGFSFNNHALLRLAETRKDDIDPTGSSPQAATAFGRNI